MDYNEFIAIYRCVKIHLCQTPPSVGKLTLVTFCGSLVSKPMPLFRYLNDDAFLIFSRKHRYLYEAALLEVHDRFFSSGAAFPTPQEVTPPSTISSHTGRSSSSTGRIPAKACPRSSPRVAGG